MKGKSEPLTEWKRYVPGWKIKEYSYKFMELMKMGVRLQCEGRLFTAALARVKVILEKQGKRLYGYERNTGESVYEQMEIIYQALGEQILSYGKEQELAVYYCALLVEAKLHPVLVFSEKRVAVGVWIYEEYNMGEALICAPEFSEEAYDAGGMLLPVDCGYLMESASFSDAVAAGCRVVEDFISAEDIVLEALERGKEPVIALVDSEGNPEEPVDLSDDETCPYFKELLFLYDRIAKQEPLAFSILSDAVRHHRWAAAFLGEGFSGKEGFDSKEEYPVLHLPEMETCEMRLTERMHQSPLLLAKVEEGRQELVAADVVLQELNQENRVLVLASEEHLEKIADFFADRKLSASILKEGDSKSLRQFLLSRCQEEEQPIDKRIDAKKRRYGEILEKIQSYNQILDERTGCGKTLGEILERWEVLQDCPVNIELPPDREWDAEILGQMKKYTDAQESCRVKDQNGEIYLDFGQLLPDEEEKLLDLLHACETPAGTFYTAVQAFGRQIGRERGANENARTYLQAITGCAELLEGCLSLIELQKAPEYIPEGQKKDREEKEAYGIFLAKQHHRQVLEQFIDTSELSLQEDEERNALLEACREVQNEKCYNHSLIKSRAYKVALKKLQELLEPVVKPGILLKNLKSEAWGSICQGLIEYSEDILEIQTAAQGDRMVDSEFFRERELRAQIFQVMSDRLGDAVSSDCYLFACQKMLVQNLLELKKSKTIPDELAKQLSACILAASRQMPLKPERRKLYEDARKVIDLSDRYSEAIKKVFRFLKIDYHTFLKSYENESMMSFIMNWEQLLEEEKVFDELQKSRVVLLRMQLGSVLEQFAEKNLEPEAMYQGFEKAWYSYNRNRYVRESGFDLQDYFMNLASMDKIKEQIYRNEELQLENRLLRKVKLACQEFSEELEKLEAEERKNPDAEEIEILSLKPELLQQIFPVMMMTPETAWRMSVDSKLCFDRILVCGAEEIPFYKILCPVTRGKSLSLIMKENGSFCGQDVTDEAKENRHGTEVMDCAAQRAREKGFPMISKAEMM